MLFFFFPLLHLQSACLCVRTQSAFKVGFQQESSAGAGEGRLGEGRGGEAGDLTVQPNVSRNDGGDWLDRRLCSPILCARVLQSIICSLCHRSFSIFPTKNNSFSENRALTCVMRIYSSRLVGTGTKTRMSESVQKEDGKIKIMGNCEGEEGDRDEEELLDAEAESARLPGTNERRLCAVRGGVVGLGDERFHLSRGCSSTSDRSGAEM